MVNKVKNWLKIVYVKINELNPAPYNPRKWDEKAERELSESIQKFGFVDPIIVNGATNRKNVVIGGHFRLHIAKRLGYETVPAVYVPIPDIEKEKEINLRLNHATGTWDYELLKTFDIDTLLDIGFDDTELDQTWNDVLGTEDDGFDFEKEVEKIKYPKAKLGDLYVLGKNRLMCGDSTNLASVKKLVGKEEPSMIDCDMPYNISLSYDKGLGGKGSYGGKTNDKKTAAEYRTFVKTTVQNALAVSSKDLHVFYWCDSRYSGMVQDVFRESGLENKRTCLWIKNGMNVTPGVAFNRVYEPCIYAVRGKPYLSSSSLNLSEIMNKEVGTGNRTIDDILDIIDIWLVKRLPGTEYLHPTQKPTTLHEKAIRRCTKPGDIILDLFGGSGSLLVAADQMKRRCFMMEYEPVFIDVIIKRYETLTNDRARKIN